MSELKPCPFCGGEAELKRYQSGDWQVICYHTDGCIMLESDLDNCYWENVQTLARQWNTRVPHGTLTAEQVRKAVYAHSIHADCADADFKAIADELNTRADRTCKQLRIFNLIKRECDGKRYSWHGDEMPNYCPNCGAKVVGE